MCVYSCINRLATRIVQITYYWLTGQAEKFEGKVGRVSHDNLSCISFNLLRQ